MQEGIYMSTRHGSSAFTDDAGPGPGTGFLAEAIAYAALSGSVDPDSRRWLGGRTAHIDMTIDGSSVQVKSASRKEQVFSPGEQAVPAVGIHLSPKATPELADWFACVVTSNLAAARAITTSVDVTYDDGGFVEVRSTSRFPTPEIYLVPGARVRDVFTRPIGRNGQVNKSEENLWAPTSAVALWRDGMTLESARQQLG